MDPAEMIIPVLSIAAAAAITFYAVSFNELKEKSWEELEKKYPESEMLDTESSVNAKERKSKKQATKAEKNIRRN